MENSDNKYYTPTIEEFHVGFEYENKQFLKHITNLNEHTEEDYTYIKCEWSKFIDFKDVFNLFFENGNIVDITVPKSIRVKYLDREDIESLNLEVFELDMGEYSAFYIKKGKDVIAAWFPDDIEENIEINDLLFTILNKSELKRLLKQLQII